MRKALAFAAILLLALGLAAAETKEQCAARRTCPADGCGTRPDKGLNRQKNRTGPPASPRTLSFAEFRDLNQQAVLKKSREKWDAAETERVEAVENGRGVTLVGFLYDATLSDPETCNCFRKADKDHDFHIWLAEDEAGARRKQFVVVEMTPRVRRSHPRWTLKRLARYTPKKDQPWTRVRVQGYALFDNEHFDFPKRKIRATAWEVHPVTAFSICPAGKTCSATGDDNWVDLDEP
jgi:hypothetical protein